MSDETITILGAGAMGSALTAPACAAGHRVRLWGTWLDDDLIESVRAGRPHPRLDVPLDPRVTTFNSAELAEALEGSTVVVLAVSSEGLAEVAELAARHLPDHAPVLLTTKGFWADSANGIRLLPELLATRLPENNKLIVAGGPCKANEVAAGRPTSTTYAGDDPAALAAVAATFAGENYQVSTTTDVTGVEVTAAMKNVYAIGLGICDGLGERYGLPWHNLKAAVFARALREMSTFAEALGGSAATVAGLAGAGDLEVTGLSGRNKAYGARIGKGQRPDSAEAEMREAGQTVEGVPAAALSAQLAVRLEAAGECDGVAFALLWGLRRVLDGTCQPSDIAGELARAALPGRADRVGM